MRQIAVSVDLYARIWSWRQDGEDSENAILERLLSSSSPALEKHRALGSAPEGFWDSRHGVVFHEGFEIFRRFKGADVRATASGGVWVLWRDGSTYGSLNQLSRAIGAGTENAWMGWHFLGDGQRYPISSMRNLDAAARRAKVPAQPSDEALWLEDVRAGLTAIDSRGLLPQITKAVEAARLAAGRGWPPAAEVLILQTLEAHSSDSDSHKGGTDLFCTPYGKGAGFWALR